MEMYVYVHKVREGGTSNSVALRAYVKKKFRDSTLSATDPVGSGRWTLQKQGNLMTKLKRTLISHLSSIVLQK